MTHFRRLRFHGILAVFCTLLFSLVYNAATSSVILQSLSLETSVNFQADHLVFNESSWTTNSDSPLMVKRVTLEPRTGYILEWNDIPSSVNYVLFQVHTQAIPLVMSYDGTVQFGNYVNSTSAGLIRLLGPNVTSASVTITNDNSLNVTAMIVVVGYLQGAPIPGACNMEFDVEIAPYLKLAYDRHKIIIEYQKGNTGYSAKGFQPPPSCDKSATRLNYYIYQYFMEERDLSEAEYFVTIENMLTVNSIRQLATQGSAVHLGPSTRAGFNAIPGQGAVYNVIVEDVNNGSWVAAYTPAGSYSCDVITNVESCDILIRPFGWIFCVVCALIGTFMCFFGHRYFKTEMFVFGFLSFAMIAFILMTKLTECNYSVRVSMTVTIGIVGGILWVTFWWFASVPVLSVLLVSLDLGFMIACIVFYTPFGNLDYLKNDINYWTTFVSFMMLPGLFLLCTLRLINIIGCAVIGSYGPILLMDRYLNTSLVYIVLNVMKRAVIPDFYLLNTDTPFQVSEISLCGVWIFLSLVGILVQVLRERKHPPFPPPPYLTWRAFKLAESRFAPRERLPEDDERRPLLGTTRSHYKATQSRSQLGDEQQDD